MIILHLLANIMFNLFGRLIIGTVRTVSSPGKFPLWIYIAFAAIVCLAGAGNGWIIGRFHRDHERAMVPLYAASMIVYLFGFAIVVGIIQSPFSVGGSAGFYFLNSVILISGILFGGTVLTLRSGGIHSAHYSTE